MLSKVIEEYKLHRKRHKDSLYNGIEYILQKHGIFRQAFHGGDINGISIRLLRSKVDIIFEYIGEYLISAQSPYNSLTTENIGELMANCCVMLKLWDSICAALSVVDPTDEDLERVSKRIAITSNHLRKMNLSVTVKSHRVEDHLLYQMKKIPGGISKLIEQWVEKYHQVGS